MGGGRLLPQSRRYLAAERILRALSNVVVAPSKTVRAACYAVNVISSRNGA